jgi:hypothetical protein
MNLSADLPCVLTRRVPAPSINCEKVGGGLSLLAGPPTNATQDPRRVVRLLRDGGRLFEADPKDISSQQIFRSTRPVFRRVMHAGHTRVHTSIRLERCSWGAPM